MEIKLSFLRNRILSIIFAAAILVNISLWVLVLFFLENGSFNVILHYNVLFGVDFKGNPSQVFIIPFIGLIIIVLNSIITKYIYNKEKFIAYLLLSASLICQIFAAIAVIAIILINSIGGAKQ